MKKGVSPTGINCFYFGAENKLRIFPPNTYKFKPRDHIVLDEVQECILDNFWYQYNNKREDKGYMLAILNSLAEYFHTINGLIQPKESPENIEKKAIYVIYKGKILGIYVSFEQVIAQKIEKDKHGGILWKKYTDIHQALTYARNTLGVNYFLEPAAKEYIQKYKKTREVKPSSSGINIKEEGPSRAPTYKEVLKKEADSLNEEYIEKKLKEKFESIFPQWKNNLKEKIMKEIRLEIDEKFKNMQKDYELKMDIPISDDDMMDIRGDSQE
uniref:Uncharacterized protein n=1 Tax=Setaria viridis TaxID=4556 RepID=A0A4U6W7J4_SETVI|nr:hypothetical protein SEVIR_1G128800v2 [Setaria viridis]